MIFLTRNGLESTPLNSLSSDMAFEHGSRECDGECLRRLSGLLEATVKIISAFIGDVVGIYKSYMRNIWYSLLCASDI